MESGETSVRRVDAAGRKAFWGKHNECCSAVKRIVFEALLISAAHAEMEHCNDDLIVAGESESGCRLIYSHRRQHYWIEVRISTAQEYGTLAVISRQNAEIFLSAQTGDGFSCIWLDAETEPARKLGSYARAFYVMAVAAHQGCAASCFANIHDRN